MPDDRRALGAWGERLAEEHLRALGFRILARNLRIGRNELDLVAIEKRTLCFVEVRTRRSTRFGTPEESVNRTKQRHLIRAAREALRSQRWPRHWRVRFDVVAVDATVEPPRLELIRNAFGA
jgi:putative endonuclease